MLGQSAVEEVHLRRSYKACDELVAGEIVQITRTVYLLNETVLHNDDARTHSHSFHLVVGYVNKGRLQFVMQLAYLRTHSGTQFRVEIAQRLVEQEYLGLAHYRASQRYALTLSARQSLGFAVEIFRNAQYARGFLNLFVYFRLGKFTQFKSERHILVYRHMRI